MKNPLTLAGIEPATYRFVAQHLNHCATAVPLKLVFGNFLAQRLVTLITGRPGNYPMVETVHYSTVISKNFQIFGPLVPLLSPLLDNFIVL